MTSTAFDWIKQFSPRLLELDEKPLYGPGPAFPWEQLGIEIGKSLQLEKLTIQPGNREWRSADRLVEGLGANPQSFTILFTALEGSLHFVISKDEILAFIELLLGTKSAAFETLAPDFTEAFSSFLAAQVINAVQKLEFDKNISPSLSEETTPPHDDAFSIDVSIVLPARTFTGRVLLSPDLLQAWKERYADRKLTVDMTSPLAQKLQINIALEAGSTSLRTEELQALNPGDFVVLDKCSFEVGDDKGRLMMTIDGVPLFRARLKQGSLKILEFPLYHELEAPMKKNESEEEDEEHFDDLDDESELEDSEVEESEIEDSEIEESEIEDLDEDEESESDQSEIEDEEEEAPKKPAATAKPKVTSAPSASKKNGPIVPTELPVNITVEVGRLQMSIQKIMELQPGNVLELDIHPENGVDLVVNGRRVAKGELVKAGDTLGVRILDIG